MLTFLYLISVRIRQRLYLQRCLPESRFGYQSKFHCAWQGDLNQPVFRWETNHVRLLRVKAPKMDQVLFYIIVKKMII